HRVIVETGAGNGIGFSDEVYIKVGAEIAAHAADVFAQADMIMKVKEPQAAEILMLRNGQVLFTYLHLAADKQQAKTLIASNAVCVAYEPVPDRNDRLPLLAPMSEVAGRMSIQVGAKCLEKSGGGQGILLGGVPGTPPAKVKILGGGASGTHAARMAVGLEADVTVIDRSLSRLNELSTIFGN